MRAKFVFGSILNELSENSTLYHRSMEKLKVGDVIKPKKDKNGEHWLSKTPFEKALELFRQEHYPDRPRRFDAIYSSVIPRSRFKDKGYLYVVKPVGKMFITNSRLIDKMNQEFDREYYDFVDRYYGDDYAKAKEEITKDPKSLLHILDYFDAKRYWEGSEKGDKEGLEVLSESAVVTEVIGIKEDHLMSKDKVEITEDNKLSIETSIYFKTKKELAEFKDKNPAMLKLIDNIKSLYSNPEEKLTEYGDSYGDSGGNMRITGYIKKGAQLQIQYAKSSMDRRKSQGEDDYDGRDNYKYTRIGFIPVKNKKGPLEFKMEYFFMFDRNIKDVSKYLKKI